ncbi:hypothetical protein BDZ88DRAFT_424228 [Geranomyces variabilis]|nr:hypothetical protein BDZ88DRAFT_424228 [Geranomyces variabilis]KAJ3136019.1 hypothetical protein HDU90_003421 [Geranomyces variabilis]
MSLSPSPSSPELKRRSSKASVNGSAYAHTANGPAARPPLPSSAATKLLSPASTSQLSNKHNQQSRPSFATLCRSFLAQWKDSGSSLPKRRRKNSAATISFSTASSAAAAMNASASAAAEAEAFYPPISRGSSSNRSRRPPLPIFTSPAASVSESHLPSTAVFPATSPLSPAVSDVTDTATLVAAGGPNDHTAPVPVKELSAQSHQPSPPPPPTADDQQTASSASGRTSTTTAISLHTYMSSSQIPTPLLEDAVTLEDQLIGLAMLRRTSLASAAAASVVEIAVSLDGTSPVLQAAPPAAVSGGGIQADAAAAASVAESVDDSLPLTAVTTTTAVASDANESPRQLQVLQQQQPITMVLPPLPPGATVSLNNQQQQKQQPITMVLPPLPPGATVTLNNGLPRPALRWTDDVRDNNNNNNPRSGGVGVPPAVAALKSRPGVTRALSDLRRSLSTLAIKLRSPMNSKDQDEDYDDYYYQDGYFTAMAAGVSPRAAAAAAAAGEGTTTTTTTPAAASPASSPSAQRRRRKRLSSTASPTSPTSTSTKTRSVTNGTSRHSVVIKDVSPESVAEALAPGTSYAQGLASLFDGEKQARDDEDDEDEDFEASELESGDDGRSSDDDASSVCTALHVDDDDEGASASESDKDLPPLPNPAPRLRRSRSEPRLRTSVVSTSSSSVFGRWTNNNNTKNAPSGRNSVKGLLPGASVSTSSLASSGSKTGSSNKPWKQLWKRLNASTTSLAVQ